MSNFITNLVTRSLGTAPVIQPRLPSLFEPSNAYPVALAESHSGWELDSPGVADEPAFENADMPPPPPPEKQFSAGKVQTQRTLKPESSLPHTQPLPADPPKREPAIPESQHVPVPAITAISRENHPAARPAALHVLPESKLAAPPRPPFEFSENTPRTPDAPASKSAPKPSSRALLAQQVLAESNLAPPRPPFEFSDNTPRAPDVPVSAPAPKPSSGTFVAQTLLPESVAAADIPPPMQSHISKSEARQNFPANLARAKTNRSRPFQEPAESLVKPAPAPERYPIGQFALRAPPIVEPPNTRRFDFARYIPPSPHTTPPEPTIQVTIGRIEVRAASPQASAPKERSPSPVMSLNDYLQQRSKRGGA
jgi:hypothetical protein